MKYLVVALLFSVLVALFAVQNSMNVSVRLFSWNVDTSLAVVVIGSATAGVVIALFVQMMVYIPLRYSLSRSRKRVQELERELASRNKPETKPTEESVPKIVAP